MTLIQIITITKYINWAKHSIPTWDNRSKHWFKYYLCRIPYKQIEKSYALVKGAYFLHSSHFILSNHPYCIFHLSTYCIVKIRHIPPFMLVNFLYFLLIKFMNMIRNLILCIKCKGSLAKSELAKLCFCVVLINLIYRNSITLVLNQNKRTFCSRNDLLFIPTMIIIQG